MNNLRSELLPFGTIIDHAIKASTADTIEATVDHAKIEATVDDTKIEATVDHTKIEATVDDTSVGCCVLL